MTALRPTGAAVFVGCVPSDSPISGAPSCSLQELIDNEGLIFTDTELVAFENFSATVDPSGGPIDLRQIRVRLAEVLPAAPALVFNLQDELLVVAGEFPAGADAKGLSIQYRVRTGGTVSITGARLAAAFRLQAANGREAKMDFDIAESLQTVSGKDTNRVMDSIATDSIVSGALPEFNDTAKFEAVASIDVETTVSLNVADGVGEILQIGERIFLASDQAADCELGETVSSETGESSPTLVCQIAEGQKADKFIGLPLVAGDEIYFQTTQTDFPPGPNALPVTTRFLQIVFPDGDNSLETVVDLNALHPALGAPPDGSGVGFLTEFGGIDASDPLGVAQVVTQNFRNDEMGLDAVDQTAFILDPIGSGLLRVVGLGDVLSFEGNLYTVVHVGAEDGQGQGDVFIDNNGIAWVNVVVERNGSPLRRAVVLKFDVLPLRVGADATLLEIVEDGTKIVEVVGIDKKSGEVVIRTTNVDVFPTRQNLTYLANDDSTCGPTRICEGLNTGDSAGREGDVISQIGRPTGVNAGNGCSIASTGPASFNPLDTSAILWNTMGERETLVATGDMVAGGKRITSVEACGLAGTGGQAIVKARFSIDDNIPEPLTGDIALGFVIPVITAGTELISTTSFVVNSPSGPFDISAFSFDPLGVGSLAMLATFADGREAVLFLPTTGAGASAVPDAVGLTQAEAEADIAAAGLTLGTVATANSDTVLAGEVISQDPAAGTEVPAGGAVDLVVSLGLPDLPPLADAGADRTAECTSPAGAPVTLDGSGSFDPDGDPLTYAWTNEFGAAAGVNPTVNLGLGNHVVTLVVNHGLVSSAPDMAAVNVVDTTAPAVVAGLTPAGGGDKGDDDEGNFRARFSAVDACDPAPSVTAVLVAQGCAAIPVSDGQVIAFEFEDDDCEVEWEDGILEIEAPNLTLRVTATDRFGNAASAEIAPAAALDD